MPLDGDWLQPFETIFAGIADFDAALRDDRLGVAMRIQRAVVETPIELGVLVDPDGAVTLTGAPPTQHVETTVMPVFHGIRMTVTADGDG